VVTRGRWTAPGILILALPFLAAACGEQDATLTGDSLVVTPCEDGRSLVLAPVDLSFDRVEWLRNSDEAGTLYIRQGWRDPTLSNGVALQFLDLPALLEARRMSPGTPVPMEGLARVTLALQARCPDAVQPLEARTGTLTLSQLDLLPAGRIAGTARFDLLDQRADPTAPPAGRDLTLTFSKDLNDKDPLTGWGR
jgi:hypothetical protein